MGPPPALAGEAKGVVCRDNMPSCLSGMPQAIQQVGSIIIRLVGDHIECHKDVHSYGNGSATGLSLVEA